MSCAVSAHDWLRAKRREGGVGGVSSRGITARRSHLGSISAPTFCHSEGHEQENDHEDHPRDEIALVKDMLTGLWLPCRVQSR
jgi:hypothetical protein